MKILTIFLMAVLLMNFSSAFLGEFDPGECVPIRTVLNVTSVNLSSVGIPAPNNTIIFINEMMTKNAQTFNFTFCETSTKGFYVYDYFDSNGETYTNDFYIGRLMTTGTAIVYVLLLLANALFFIFFMIVAIKTPYANLKDVQKDGIYVTRVTRTKYVKLLSVLLASITFAWFFAIITGLTNNFISFAALTSMMTNMYILIQFIFQRALPLVILTALFILFWMDIVLNHRIKKFGKAFLK